MAHGRGTSAPLPVSSIGAAHSIPLLTARKAEPSGWPAASLVAPLRGYISGGHAPNDTQPRKPRSPA